MTPLIRHIFQFFILFFYLFFYSNIVTFSIQKSTFLKSIQTKKNKKKETQNNNKNQRIIIIIKKGDWNKQYYY